MDQEQVLRVVFEWGPNEVHRRQGDGVVCGRKIKVTNKLEMDGHVATSNQCQECFTV